jgi:hypothetical protein
MTACNLVLIASAVLVFSFAVQSGKVDLKGHSAYQSSDHVENEVKLIANKSIDGDNGNSEADVTRTCSHTQFDMYSWWIVDLGKNMSLTAVKITPMEGYEKSLESFIVGALDKAESDPQVGGYTICNQYTNDKEESFTVTCWEKMPPRRYVIIQLPGRNFLRMCEVEIYADVVNSDKK